jgi:hypothetical protein
MKPRLIRNTLMIGSDGRKRIVQSWQAFHFAEGSTIPGVADKWIPNAFLDLRTDDGLTVDCEDEEKGVFRIRDTNVVLHRTTRG